MPGRTALRAPTEGKLQGGGPPRAITLEKTLVPHRSLRFESTSFCFVFLDVSFLAAPDRLLRFIRCKCATSLLLVSEATRCVTCIMSVDSELSSSGEVFKQYNEYNFENFPLYG